MTTPALDTLIRRARRRMRLNRALMLAGMALPVAAAGAIAWFGAARLVLLPDADGLVVALLAAGVAATVVVGAAVRIPAVWAAWAADVWWQTRDHFSTAVELAATHPAEGTLAHRQVTDAELV